MRRPLFGFVTLVIVGFASALPAGEEYALLVAVGDYDLKDLRPLKYTRADVLDFHQVLVEAGFPPKNIVLMHDDLRKLVEHYEKLGDSYRPRDYLPEFAKIRHELELMLGRLRSDDSIVVAFSGHGVLFKNEKKSYFCPADAKLEEKNTLISFEEVYAALKDCRAGRKLFLVDACQNDPLSEIGKSRKAIDLESVTRPQTEPIPQGIIALFSCTAGQRSFESPELGHGLFFHHLLDGWKGWADRNGDGKITYQELAEHTEIKTAEFAALKLKVLQTPLLKTDFSGEWVLRNLKTAPAAMFDASVGATTAQARAAQTAWAKYLNTAVELENSVGINLVLIPPGEYLRGSGEAVAPLARTFGENEAFFGGEYPQHRVRLSRAFFLGATEVTRGQFRRFVSATGYVTESEKGEGGWGWNESLRASDGPDKRYSWKNTGFVQTDDHPVVNVSWNDAVAFCKWLSKEEGKAYRLPTEAEWEYACRAGTLTYYASGNDPLTLIEVGITADASLKEKWTDLTCLNARDRHVFTAPVKKYQRNGFGLWDMHGNAWEWCADWYDPREYLRFADRIAVDPKGPQTGTARLNRGGGWYSWPVLVRSAHRDSYEPEKSVDCLGFRVLAEISPPNSQP